MNYDMLYRRVEIPFFSFLMAELVNSEGELTNRSLFRVPPFFLLLLFNPFLRSLILSQFLIKSMHERQEEQVEMMNYVQQRISQDEFKVNRNEI